MSKLEELNKTFRDTNVAKNVDYTESKQYNQGHPNAISDGDKKGKNSGSDQGGIGDIVDITKRTELLTPNPYWKKEYNVSNNS